MRRIGPVSLALAFAAGLMLTPVRHVVAAVAFGLVWAILAAPAYRLARRSLRGPAAAVLTLAFTGMLVLAPLALLGSVVVSDLEGIDVAVTLQSWGPHVANLPGGAGALQTLSSAASSLRPRMTEAALLGLLQLPLALTVAYQGLRRGFRLWLRALPLLPVTTSQALDLGVRARTTVRGVARGQVLTALAKGGAGALGFWIAGVPDIAMWGCVMAVFTFLPVLTAWMVWVPAALWLASQGHLAAAAFLAGWGMLVMGLLDNILRPILVGSEARIDPVLAMIGMAAGAATLGVVGLVAGPVLVDLFVQGRRMREGHVMAEPEPKRRFLWGKWWSRAVRSGQPTMPVQIPPPRGPSSPLVTTTAALVVLEPQ